MFSMKIQSPPLPLGFSEKNALPQPAERSPKIHGSVLRKTDRRSDAIFNIFNFAHGIMSF